MRGFVRRLEVHTAARARAGQYVGCDEANLKALYETEPHRYVVIEQDIAHFDHVGLRHCASDADVNLLILSVTYKDAKPSMPHRLSAAMWTSTQQPFSAAYAQIVPTKDGERLYRVRDCRSGAVSREQHYRKYFNQPQRPDERSLVTHQTFPQHPRRDLGAPYHHGKPAWMSASVVE